MNCSGEENGGLSSERWGSENNEVDYSFNSTSRKGSIVNPIDYAKNLESSSSLKEIKFNINNKQRHSETPIARFNLGDGNEIIASPNGTVYINALDKFDKDIDKSYDQKYKLVDLSNLSVSVKHDISFDDFTNRKDKKKSRK